MSILILFFLFHGSHGEIFTALVDLNRAFNSKTQLGNDLLNFAVEQKSHILYLKNFSKRLLSHLNNDINPELYLSDPLNAYSSIVYINNFWTNEIPDLISTHAISEKLVSDVHKMSQYLPTKDDVSGVADALIRLQSTYKIATQKIADGSLYIKHLSYSFTSKECFDIGLKHFQKDFFHSVQWITEAYNRMETDININGKTKIIDYLSYGYFKQGNFRQALSLTNQWLKIDPLNTRAQENKVYFQDALYLSKNSNKFTKGDETDIFTDETAISVRPLNHIRDKEFRIYEALCRNENPIQYKKSKNLICRYFIPHHYFLLAPIREEILHYKPRIVMYHNVISDKEIEEIKQLSISRLNRATVQNSITGVLEFASYRISKSAWLKTELSSTTKKINRRIEMLTGINLDTAEELQVVNYGIGGHYEPHFDFARKREAESFEKIIGNRVATLLFYMSDVDAGGATVFTEIGAKVWPKKGSAAFWWNLYPNGDGDLTTRHAACPVLEGSKWVMNKWFHERGQELIRPCALNKYASSVSLKTVLNA